MQVNKYMYLKISDHQLNLIVRNLNNKKYGFHI